MVNEERDTQFRNFARLLLDELRTQAAITVEPRQAFDYVRPVIERIIAQRAYDLVGHVLGTEKVQWCAIEDIRMSDIPDMTELPTEQGHERA